MRNILFIPCCAPHAQALRIFQNGSAGLLLALMLLLLSGFSRPANAASGFYKNFVIINGTYYYTNACTGPNCPPNFQSLRNIGTFDRGLGLLVLGAEANTFNDNGDDVQSVQLFYRVYLDNSIPGPFVPLGLAFVAAGGDGSPNNKRWANTTTSPNLLTGTSGPGRYVLELYFQGTVAPGSGGANVNIFDLNNNGNNYLTTFDVTGSVPVQWTGSASDDWFTPANWAPNTVPTPTTDATIPYISGGAAPTIRGGLAQVRTLRISGNNGMLGARNFLQGGELQVFGDFQDPHGGFGQTGGLFTLAGVTQTFDGAVFSDVRIQGGGTKTLTNRMEVTNTLTFAGLGGTIITRLDNSLIFNVDLGTNAQVIGEDETSHVMGILRAPNRLVTQFQAHNFGNIGVELTALNGSPGNTLATRLTGFVYNGAGTSVSIKRSFAFTPANPNDLNFTLAFRYFTGELNGIQEGNLALFRSLTGGIPFVPLYSTSLDPNNNVLTRANIAGTLAATFTLGDNTNPLPVSLTHFTAVAQGPDALLTWATAQEKDSRGFEVQTSADGQAFRKLAFVASETPNSSARRLYQYRDLEEGKQGVRYYRLRQLDLNGQEVFYGPKAVAFSTFAAASAQAYPNPFTAEITLKLQSPTAGPATVQVLDAVGRQVRTWQPMLAPGPASLRLAELQSLRQGLYLVQVRYHNGQTRHLQLVKE